MWDKLKERLLHLVTEPDNKTTCPVRIVAIAGFLYALGTHAFSIYYQHVAFDLQAFGIAFGTMLTTLGASLGLKSDTKPEVN